MSSAPQLRVATLNVRGLNSKRKQCQLLQLMSLQQVDVLAVQETKLSGEEETEIALKPFLNDFEVCVTHATGTSAGCFLFLKQGTGLTAKALTTDREGRFIVCDLTYGNDEWRIMCVYAPNAVNARNDFFLLIEPYLSTDRKLLLLGDFNCVLNFNDRSQFTARFDPSAALLQSLVNENNLADIGEHKGSRVHYTHFQRSSHARLDRIYISGELYEAISDYTVKPVFFSDHCLVSTILGEKKRHSVRPEWRLWKLNTTLLDDEIFTDRIPEILLRVQQIPSLHIFCKWDMFKQDVKNWAIERASTITFEKRRELKTLFNMLSTLYELESKKPGEYTEEINMTKTQLQRYDAEKHRGAVIRSRSQKFLLGETPGRRSLEDERKYALTKEIVEIEHKDSTRIDTPNISEAFVDYYTSLFGKSIPTEESTDIEELVRLVPSLSDEEKQIVDGSLTLQEIQSVIKALPSNKTPGPDGLSAEFYRKFSDLLSPLLLDVLKASYEHQTLPPTFYHGHTVLIPKTEDTLALRKVEAYRPISLCNVDYKIFAKVLNERLHIVIHNLIGEHQTCGIRERNIQTNIHVARSVIDSVSDEQDQVAIVQLDLSKAFDRVSHSFLFKLLSHANVGTMLLEGIRLCYKNSSTRLIVNNSLSDSIHIKSSVRQGCPLSPLFLLYTLSLYA